MDEPCPKSDGADPGGVYRKQATPNFAGLTCRAQQAEMKLILDGKWPALKPLPVFKFETDEYRAAIDFDKLRGEWVCRKTSFPSNKVQELRCGLTELTLALPHGPAAAFAEDVATEQPEQELQKDASRRHQALLEWRTKYENGAFFSELENYLSKPQQQEIYDCIRLTLTARQLQFIPKNVSYVFDALSKAGGRLAMLVELAQRNKARRGADPEEQAANLAPEPMGSFFPESSESLSWMPVESHASATFEKLPTEPVTSVLSGQDHPSTLERSVHDASQVPEIVTPEIQDASPAFFAEENVQEKVRRHILFAGFGAQGRTNDGVKRPSSHKYVLEISGFHVAAIAVVILFVAISFTLGLTTGRSPLGKRLWDAQKSVVASDAPPPTLPGRLSETASQTPVGAYKSDGPAPSEKNASENVDGTESPAKVAPADSSPITESKSTAHPTVSPERKSATELIARNARPLARPNPAHSLRAGELKSSALKSAATRRVAYARNAAPHASGSSAILVRGPGDGGKPFRLTLPEKPIAASSTFAMTSQLSVVVSPESGLAGARPARLQAGELVSFVWPRYPRAGDRYGSSETVKVRTTIGPLGQVEDVKLVGGSASLLPAAISAIRQWRYKPTLVNERPVQAQEDVTIEFRR